MKQLSLRPKEKPVAPVGPAGGPNEQKLIVFRACQLAQALRQTIPSDDCYANATRWTQYVLKTYQPTDEQKALLILTQLQPKAT